MTAHNSYQDYDLSTPVDMTFDEVFPDVYAAATDDTATMDATATKPHRHHHKQQQRYDSAPYDEHQSTAMPTLAPVSPCYSEESSASSTHADDMCTITGRCRNIEYDYHVNTKVLGTGHHGSVRECIHRQTGQRYAVKSIRKNDSAVKPGGLAREIMLLQEMKHDSIVGLVDVYEDADYIHIVTELCTGGELFDRIVAKSESDANGVPCFTETEAAKVIHQLLHAISYMHKHSIVHRDIKPENILFETNDEDSPIQIIDFGLARKHHVNDPSMSTIVGTPYYISPDVLRRKYDRSCDLWSVGVISYIVLCGYPPFNGSDNKEVYDAVRRGRYRFPSADWNHTSRESRDFVRRLLQKDPRKRMTVEEALNHPWIVYNVNNNAVNMIEEDEEDESRDCNSSVEVVFHNDRNDSIICPTPDGSPARPRGRRLSLFADL